jgi:Family of unknown function (DUF6461)
MTRRGRPRVPGYDWVEEVDAVTITYVRGLDLRSVGNLLRFEWETERAATFAEAEWQQDFETAVFAVQAEQVGPWLLLIEPNGYLSADPETLSALSDADVALSAYWNVNAQMRFAMFADGVQVRSFDPLLPDLGPMGQPLSEEAGLPFGIEGERAEEAMLLLAERLTGVSVQQDWLLGQPRPTWTVRALAPGN